MTRPGSAGGDHLRWQCSRCAAAWPVGELRYACTRCRWAGRLTLLVDYERIGAGRPPADVLLTGERSLWRYAPLLPVDADGEGVRRVRTRYVSGWTPLHRADRLARRLGLGRLWIKDEAGNPSGALKDRASVVAVADALDRGRDVIATASSGNAGAALAGAAAAVGLRCVVFVPRGTPPAKVTQISRFGARVLLVDGDYDAAVRLSTAACRRWDWYCRNTAYNPCTAEGKKTAALEIVEQLGWSAPDAVVAPVGDGNILVGLYRGLCDARAMGWIDRVPRLIGVQAAAAPAVHRAWAEGAADVRPAPARTRADSINVGEPQDGYRALAAVRDTGGAMVAVEEEEISAAVDWLAAESGVYPEPASAAGAAALPALVARGELGSADHVVLLNTGSGLKAAPSAAGANAVPVAADLRAVAALGITGAAGGGSEDDLDVAELKW
ncbi:threonine synthase [Actinomadura sp. DSM 109109]|nr:threonine synthase [Actinomadura lepetitiana]